jgi:hypothetical protein
MYLAPSVEIVLFQMQLDVVRSAERVDTSPGYWIRLPPAVRRTRCVSDLLGRMSTTNRPYYVITFPLGTALCGIKKLCWNLQSCLQLLVPVVQTHLLLLYSRQEM